MDADESEHVVTVAEFMENQDAEEESADLVLGGDEGKECTYQNGYLTRQAVFSCLTCAPLGNAGVCTACSLTCHDGHEIVELWTKRRFRCDCGNSKFGGAECKLWKSKDVENSENGYNQNFVGLYCTCHRRYPDPEDEELGEMLQCCICEDWFHETHLGLDPAEKVPRDDDGELLFDELICQSCIARCSFLSRYPELLIKPAVEAADEKNTAANGTVPVDETETAPGESAVNLTANGDVTETFQAATNRDLAGTSSTKIPLADSLENLVNVDVAGSTQMNSQKEPALDGDASQPKSHENVAKDGDVAESSQTLRCKLGDGNTEVKACLEKAVFLDRNWRSEICHCDACKDTYKSRGVSFLLDEEDNLQSYEAMAKERRQNKLEQAEGAGMKLLQNLNHVHKVEFLHGLNDMTSELSNFFGDFRDSGKTVTSADIHEFFDKLKQKRRKLA